MKIIKIVGNHSHKKNTKSESQIHLLKYNHFPTLVPNEKITD